MARIEPNWKDEILSGEPKYLIRNASNEIILEDAFIDMTTPIVQGATDLNKLNLETPIGEIRAFAGARDDDKYLLCDGSLLNITDYPQLANAIDNKVYRYIYYSNLIDPEITYASASKYNIKYIDTLNLFVATYSGYKTSTSNHTTRIWTSTDGINWTLRYVTDAANGNIATIQYVPEFNKYIAYGTGDYGMLLMSSDCLSWTVIEQLGNYSLGAPCYVPALNQLIYTVENSNSHKIHYLSQNGTVTVGANTTPYLNRIYEKNGILYGDQGSADYLTLYRSTDNGSTWSSYNPYTIKMFYPSTAITMGNYAYSFWNNPQTLATGETYIGRLNSDGTCETITQYSGSEVRIRGFEKIGNYILAINDNGDLIKIDENGVNQVGNIGSKHRAHMYILYLRNLSEILIGNEAVSTEGVANEIIRLDPITFEKKNSTDVLYNNYLAYSINVANDIIYVQSQQTTSSSSNRNGFSIYNNRQFNLPLIESQNMYMYIKALGGE